MSFDVIAVLNTIQCDCLPLNLNALLKLKTLTR